jgi:hypothetical protein
LYPDLKLIFMSRTILITALIMLVLAGCGNPATPVSLTASSTLIATAPSTLSPTTSPSPVPTIPSTVFPTTSLESLRDYLGIDESCPHICWGGINPGVTSAEEARVLLGTTQAERYETFLGDAHIFVYFDKNVVKSIYFDGLSDYIDTLGRYALSDYIRLLGGNPDEIRIAIWGDYHCGMVGYLLYFSSRKTVLEIIDGGTNGLHPRDWVFGMALNVEFDATYLQGRSSKVYDDKLSARQPWLGFGHLHEYLPGQKTPADPCLTPDPAFAP